MAAKAGIDAFTAGGKEVYAATVDAHDRQSLFSALIIPPVDVSANAFAIVLDQHLRSATRQAVKDRPAYVWNREPLSMSPAVQVHDGVTVLTASMRVGDAIEDEWFGIWLLRQATIRFPGMAVEVHDEDGQFLLIEAADHLPSWVTPENASNRVWLRQGRLCLIPPSVAPSEGDEASLSVGRAARLLQDYAEEVFAPAAVEDAAFARLESYPLAAGESTHRALAYLPPAIARLLAYDHQLVASIIEALCTRDVVAVRALQRMEHFPPIQSNATATTVPSGAAILTSVTFSRRLYAQLVHERFLPPKPFGKEWQSKVEQYWAMTDSNGTMTSDSRESAKLDCRWWDIGCKLTAGTELLYTHARQRRALKAGTPLRSPTAADTIEQSLALQGFWSSLSNLGYFGNEISGSLRWKELHDEAAQMWLASLQKDARAMHQLSGYSIEQIAERIEIACNADQAPQDLRTSSPAFAEQLHQAEEDNEDWLYLAEDSHEVGRVTGPGMDEEFGDVAELSDLAKRMQSFINREGDLQGAEFFDDVDKDASDTDSDDSDHANGTSQRESNNASRTLARQQVENLSMSERQAAQALIVQKLAANLTVQEKSTQDPTLVSSTKDDKPLRSVEKKSVALPAPLKFSTASQTSPLHVKEQLFKQQFDGASDTEESMTSDEDLDTVEEKLQRAKELGLQEDDTLGAKGFLANEKSAEEELRDFLNFTKSALGLSEEQYQSILEERKKRARSQTQDIDIDIDSAASESGRPLPFFTVSSRGDATAQHQAENSSPFRNPHLDNFDSLMRAMEAELTSKNQHTPDAPFQFSGMPDSHDIEKQNDGIEARQTSKRVRRKNNSDTVDVTDTRDDNQGAATGSPGDDLELISNFMRSFAAQGGGPGPVGNLAARLGATLPRNVEDS